MAVLLAAALAGGIFAVVQRGEARNAAAEARDAETVQLAQRLGAQALVEEDLDRSLLLARQAVAIDDTPQTRGYLLAALRRAPAVSGIMHGPDNALLGAIALSPDGTTLAVGYYPGGLLFFDTRTHEQIGELPVEPGGVDGLAYSPDGRTLALGGGGSLRLIDARTRGQLAESPGVAWAGRMAFTKDGSQLVFVDANTPGLGVSSISIREADTLEPIGPSIAPEGFRSAYIGTWPVSPTFALTPDDDALITASEDGELAWWDLRSGKKTRTLPIATGLHALALSPDGLTAAVGIDRGIQFVDVTSGEVRSAAGALTGSPNSLLFSPDGQTVVSTSIDGTVTLWDVASETPRETLRGHSNSVWQSVFSPDGETLYTVSHDGTAIAWDITGNRRLGRPFTFTHDRTFNPGWDGHPGRFSPDGRLIAVGLKEEGIRLWNANDLSPAGAPLLNTGGEVKSLAFSPDGRTLAAVALGGQATIWDVASHSLRRGPFVASSGAYPAVSFSPDGMTLATAGPFGVKLWDVATGSSLGEIGSGNSSDVAFSADGTMIAFPLPGAGTAEVWDVAKRSRIATVEGDVGWYESVALSPDGRMLAVGDDHGAVRLWDVRRGKLVRELDQRGAGAFTLEFSSDGRVLAVSGFEPVASLWDVASGTQIGPRLTVGTRRAMMDLSADDRRLLMTSANGEGAVWDIDPESGAQRACRLANRTLTREEWEEFLPGRPYEPACG